MEFILRFIRLRELTGYWGESIPSHITFMVLWPLRAFIGMLFAVIGFFYFVIFAIAQVYQLKTRNYILARLAKIGMALFLLVKLSIAVFVGLWLGYSLANNQLSYVDNKLQVIVVCYVFGAVLSEAHLLLGAFGFKNVQEGVEPLAGQAISAISNFLYYPLVGFALAKIGIVIPFLNF